MTQWTLSLWALSLALVATCLLSGGCGSSNKTARAIDSTPMVDASQAPPQRAASKNESLVFRGKYSRTTGPCIQIGDALAMPLVDRFEVIEVLQGNLDANSIHVRAMTEGGDDYPNELIAEQTYTVRLTPAQDTSQQLQENRTKGNVFLWVNGDEIRLEK